MRTDRLTKRAFTRPGLTRLGFTGWVTFSALKSESYRQIPTEAHGVYVVLRGTSDPPRYARRNPAGRFRGDPTVTPSRLSANWVDGARTVYIGKADPRQRSPHALRTRLKEFAVFGDGGTSRHWGGRLVFQLSDAADLLVAWMPTPGERAKDVEDWLIAEFRRCYGKPPFANHPDRLGR